MNETIPLTSGSTYYGCFFQGSDVYDFTGAAMVSAAAATEANCDVALTEIGSSGLFAPATPTGLPAGTYTWVVFEQAGGSPAFRTDVRKWVEEQYIWDGSARGSVGSSDVSISAAAVWSYTSRGLTTGVLRVNNPWQVGSLNIIKGASSPASRYVITKSDDWDWPSNLTTGGFTVTLEAIATAATLVYEPTAPDFTNTGNVLTATTVDLGAMTSANTDTLVKPNGNGANAYDYEVWARKAGEAWLLESGNLSVG